MNKNNLFYKIKDLVVNHNYSILGICVGMQALFESSEEGNETGLGFFNYKCKKFDSNIKKVPHIGWNKIKITKNKKIFSNIKKDYFYFAIFLCKGIDQVLLCLLLNILVSLFHQYLRNIYGVHFSEKLIKDKK